MHRCWKCVIGTLGHIDMVIGMKEFFPCHFIPTICNHFIEIHIGLGAASCLPYNQRKLSIQFTCQNLVANLTNIITTFLIHFADFKICHGCGFFQNGKGTNDFCRHFFCTDFKIFIAALCLRSPIYICGHLYLPHRIMFHPIR